MPDVDIICLANSRKLQGRCVAGLRTDGQGWVRPVGRSLDGTLYSNSYIHDRGAEAALLDVLRIPVTGARPEPHQPENWLLGSGRWRLVDRIPLQVAASVLQPFLARGPTLLGNVGDRIAFEPFNRRPATASLALVEPASIEWRITRGARGNRQTRVRFSFRESSYDLSVTDPVMERRLGGLPEGPHSVRAAGFDPLSRLILTVSLGEPFKGDCYKLVAGVLVLDRAEKQTGL